MKDKSQNTNDKVPRFGSLKEARLDQLGAAGGRGGLMLRWQDDDFEAFIFFVNAGSILKVVEQAPT